MMVLLMFAWLMMQPSVMTRVVNLRAVDLGAGQIARARKNRRAHVEEIEARQFGNQIQVRLEKGADGADVLPIALKDVGENAVRFDGVRDDVLAEIGKRIVEQVADEVAVENINAHRGEKRFAAVLDADLFAAIPAADCNESSNAGFLRLFHKARDALVVVRSA